MSGKISTLDVRPILKAQYGPARGSNDPSWLKGGKKYKKWKKLRKALGGNAKSVFGK